MAKACACQGATSRRARRASPCGGIDCVRSDRLCGIKMTLPKIDVYCVIFRCVGSPEFAGRETDTVDRLKVWRQMVGNPIVESEAAAQPNNLASFAAYIAGQAGLVPWVDSFFYHPDSQRGTGVGAQLPTPARH